LDCIPEADRLLPRSFADWLAQPAGAIMGGSEQEQGIFAGLLNECHVETGRPPRKACRR
jgi:hypothetical protein